MNSFASNGAAGAVRLRTGRDLSPIARSMAHILVNLKVALDDGQAVERMIRDFHPEDMFDEVDRLIEICPDMARAIIAESGEVS